MATSTRMTGTICLSDPLIGKAHKVPSLIIISDDLCWCPSVMTLGYSQHKEIVVIPVGVLVQRH